MAAASDYDSAWKEALEHYFPDFMALLWPALHVQIDWRQAPVFRDKELQALMRSAKQGRRHVDKLVSVQLLGGQPSLLWIHVEVQGGHEAGFAHRMYTYYIRLHEKHPDEPLVSLAVLTTTPAPVLDRASASAALDPMPTLAPVSSEASDPISIPALVSPLAPASGSTTGRGRESASTPTLALAMPGQSPMGHLSYQARFWDCSLQFVFPVMYLEAWRPRIDELRNLADTNPFAVVMLAQLDANATRAGPQRLVRKTELVRQLYHWGYQRDNVIILFRIIDAMLALPDELEGAFEDAVLNIEEETQMSYVTSIERVRLRREREEGRQEGELEGREAGRLEGELKGKTEGFIALLSTQLIQKFGDLPDWAKVRLQTADEAALSRWAEQILDTQRIEDVFR